jgi:eukaryotic-like serine/threonine-protein kinase
MSEPTDDDLQPGVELGAYRVLRKLGQGGMGQVYLAEHLRMKRQVALKVLPRAFSRNVTAVRRFQREVEALARLSHPNIVAAHDAGEALGLHYLVMAYVEGRDLKKVVEEEGPLPVARAVSYLIQAALGLEEAHREGMVHRDVKPANLFLDRQGRVILLDLGLARLNEPEEGEAFDLTQTGTGMGTPDYISPEQANDAKSVDGRTDIYSLGATLYFLLAGRPMYGGTRSQRIIGHQSKPIPPLTAREAAAPAELDWIYRKMVAKDVAERYRSAAEVLEDLRQLGGTPVSPTPSSPRPPSDLPRNEASRSAEERLVVMTDGIELPLRWCPPGTFVMGSPERDAGRGIDEDQVKVTLTKGFWMAEWAVTQELYQSVIGTNPAHFEGPRRPVEMVSWEDAVAFCARLTARERSAGRLSEAGEYRLPTEAEWEYACRAGTTTATAFGNSMSSVQANFDGNYPYNGAAKGPYLGATREVGKYAANAWGLKDMHGNVWEWCADWYVDQLKGGTNPLVVMSRVNENRVLRGGSWITIGLFCRSSIRGRNAPGVRDPNFGFRCLRTE